MSEASHRYDPKLQEAIRLFDAELVSLGCAAHMAEMSRAEFLAVLHQEQIAVLRTTPEEIAAEVEAFTRNRQ
ncbi:MAG: UPF0175 family protein [Aquabacterium sp.]|uniref:UPF0175 family protein n=1 Tax=Aquabacterium sp. TaxID=1872578 RepID=UPI0025BC23C6|nr:UPF0175 family protein [Aquabacterium sp.]MBI5925078.1 UPF0175 family protein [Aquabacterium sp.]